MILIKNTLIKTAAFPFLLLKTLNLKYMNNQKKFFTGHNIQINMMFHFNPINLRSTCNVTDRQTTGNSRLKLYIFPERGRPI